jgi:Immunity protein Imm1
MIVDIEVLGRVRREYFCPGEWVLHQPNPVEVAALLDELCAPSGDERFWNNPVVSHVDATDGVEFVVAPLTGYVALYWTQTAQRSLNPHPFPDAPLLPSSGDDDPMLYWPRSSYLHPADAKKALVEHLVTGRQPTCVAWQPWGWEVHEFPLWLNEDMPEYPYFHLITD